MNIRILSSSQMIKSMSSSHPMVTTNYNETVIIKPADIIKVITLPDNDTKWKGEW
jgi:hypothetical protein